MKYLGEKYTDVYNLIWNPSKYGLTIGKRDEYIGR